MCTHPISPVNGSAASYVFENRLRRTSPRASWRSIRSPGELAEHPVPGRAGRASGPRASWQSIRSPGELAEHPVPGRAGRASGRGRSDQS
jgi:hypothetical protein